ncbi:MAG: secretin and TonB N-terminal domain-containing protein [Candidatus Omnitrophota bacterium]
MAKIKYLFSFFILFFLTTAVFLPATSIAPSPPSSSIPAGENPSSPPKELQPPPGTVSLDFKNADIRNVLRILAAQNNLNIIAGKEVEGTVTVHLSNVPLEDALRAILGVNGFGYEKVGNLTLVSTLANLSSRNHLLTTDAFVTKIFTLNYISAEKIKDIVQKQLSPGGTVDVMTDLHISGWEMSGVSTTSTTQGKKLREKSALEEKPKILIVTDFPAIVNRIEVIIKQLDVKPSQILIDAMIVEIGSEYVRDIGIDWSITKTNNITYGFTSLPVTGVDYSLSLIYENSPLTIKIKALETAGKANILSNPRIMTLDNYPAVIMVGERYPIMTTTTTLSGTTPITTGSLSHYEPIGISLRVIPHVNQEGAVEMVLHPEITSLGASVISGTGVGVLTLPRINSREADTTVTVKNGQTAVIGGLLTNETKVTFSKIPFLGDIPILGYLFKRTKKEPKKVELLIFITPHVVNEPADAAKLLQEKTAQIK